MQREETAEAKQREPKACPVFHRRIRDRSGHGDPDEAEEPKL
jgi:hypothetical protein